MHFRGCRILTLQSTLKLLGNLLEVRYNMNVKNFNEIIDSTFSLKESIQNSLRTLIDLVKKNLKKAEKDGNQASINYYKKYLMCFTPE